MKTLKTKTALIFDLDGTLLNTLGDIANAANASLIHHKFKPFSKEEIRFMIGDGSKVLVERMLFARNMKDSTTLNEVHSTFLQKYSTQLSSETELYPGVMDSLARLRLSRAKNSQLLVCTNKPHELALRLVASSPLREYFPPNFVTGAKDSVPKKPNPSHLLHTFERAQLDARDYNFVVVGDGQNDIQVAQAMNGKSVAVTYGYSSENDLAKYNPDSIAHSFDQAMNEAIKLTLGFETLQ